MGKIDFKKELKEFYNPSKKEIVAVTVPAMNFLMIDGEGDPNSSKEFADAIETLYPVAYTLKFMVKKGTLEIEYGVMPLEALWWADDMNSFVTGDKSKWKWTLMIMQPDFISEEMVRIAIEEVTLKKNPPSISKIRYESFEEGNSAQIMYVGPFADEGPAIERVHQFIDSRSSRRGKHHEIYLSDMRRTDPTKWKTVIRQPMA